MFSGPSIPPDHRMTPHRSDDGPLLSGLLMTLLAVVAFVILMIGLVVFLNWTSPDPTTSGAPSLG